MLQTFPTRRIRRHRESSAIGGRNDGSVQSGCTATAECWSRATAASGQLHVGSVKRKRCWRDRSESAPWAEQITPQGAGAEVLLRTVLLWHAGHGLPRTADPASYMKGIAAGEEGLPGRHPAPQGMTLYVYATPSSAVPAGLRHELGIPFEIKEITAHAFVIGMRAPVPLDILIELGLIPLSRPATVEAVLEVVQQTRTQSLAALTPDGSRMVVIITLAAADDGSLAWGPCAACLISRDGRLRTARYASSLRSVLGRLETGYACYVSEAKAFSILKGWGLELPSVVTLDPQIDRGGARQRAVGL